MTSAATLLLALLLAQGHGTKGAAGKRTSASAAARRPARAHAGPAPESAREATGAGTTEKSASAGEVGSPAGEVAVPAPGGKTMKTKVYNFGAMDVEGKLKTPQLLYFLNRVKLELDMSAPDQRSFMKELEKSADDKNL
jgi:hypothetical protein